MEMSIPRKELYEGEPRASHRTHADRLAKHARELLAKGDRVQASEKAWGAVAHELARIASQYGKKLNTHGELKTFVSRLADKHNDRMLWILTAAVENAHTNFYKDTLRKHDIQLAIDASDQLRYLLRQYEPIAVPKRRIGAATGVRRTPRRK